MAAPGSCPAWRLDAAGWRAIAWVSGVALPTLNGVWAERADPDPGAVGGLLDRVKATGLPYCLQLRPGASPALAELAAARAMSLETQIPLWSWTIPSRSHSPRSRRG